MKTTRKYHGWVLVEAAGPDFKDHISVEWSDADGRHHEDIGRGDSGCAKAVEWWDAKLGVSVQLQPTLKGAYRVYTEEKETAADRQAKLEAKLMEAAKHEADDLLNIARPIRTTMSTQAIKLAELATAPETPRRPDYINRRIVEKMAGELIFAGFNPCPDLDGEHYSVWHYQPGTPGALEVRLFNNRFFRIVSWDGNELATGCGIIQLKSALRSQAVR